MRARPLVVPAALVLSTVLTAGCIADTEEATVEDPAAFGLRWQENFTVPEDGTAAFVNVTVERLSENTSRVEFRVLNPANETVIVEDAEWPEGRQRATVNAVLGPETARTGQTTSHAALEPGEWSYEVHAQGSVQVRGDVVVLTESNGHREV